MFKKSGLIFSMLLVICVVMPVLAESDEQESQTYTTNKIAKYGDFDFELWRDEGEALMTVYKDGTFLCEWDKSKTSNVLFRNGKKLGSTQTHEEIGNMSLEYACDYQPEGNSYLCLYGWSVDPLVEFYILENFTTYNPGTDGTTFKGLVTIDGDIYKIYEGERVDKPSIKGTTTFKQYWSIRETKRSKGTISISEHFKAWEEVGLELGNLYEVSLCVEGYKSSGYANVYSNRLTIGDDVMGVVSELDTGESVADETGEFNESNEIENNTQSTESIANQETTSTDMDAETNSENNSNLTIPILIVAVVVIGILVFLIRKRISK